MQTLTLHLYIYLIMYITAVINCLFYQVFLQLPEKDVLNLHAKVWALLVYLILGLHIINHCK